MKHRGQDYYEFAKVLYRDDDTPGYRIADMVGTEEEVELKASKLWKDYEVFPLISSTPKENNYSVEVSPNYVATFFDWYYSPESGKWFISEEPIPLPKSKCEKSNKFKIHYEVRANKNKLEDLLEQYKAWYEEDGNLMFTTETEIEFVSDSSSYKRSLYFSLNVLSKMQKFVGTTIQEEFAVFTPDEEDLFKIIAWKKDDNTIRIQIQDYSGEDKVKVVFEAEISLVNFIVAFEMYFNKVTIKHCEMLQEVQKSYK